MKNTNKKTHATTGTKKLSLLLTLKSLELAGEKRQPVKQINIANMVNELGKKFNLDIYCDRKTVGRHLKLLTALGYDIINVKGQGYYIKSYTFTRDEAKILKDLIENSSITDSQKKILIEKTLYRPNFISADALKKFFSNDSTEDDI